MSSLNSSLENGTMLASSSVELPSPAQFEYPALFVGLLGLSLLTIFGNALVIIAVLRERSLHSSTNYFITSLAVSDLLVGTVVMPFSAFYEAMDQKWVFGEDWCDGWHSFDVLASTASILNLCVISLDRFWAIKEPMSYPAKMTSKKAAFLIVIVWLCSSAISFPAIAWWRATDVRPIPPLTCPFTEDTGYLVFSSIVSFYGPLAVMLIAYYRIFRTALEHEKSLRKGVKQMNTNGGQNANGQEVTLRIHRGGGGGSKAHSANVDLVGSDGQVSYKNNYLISAGTQGFNLSRKLAKFTKEKKAAKTLGTVMGIFIICWLPFFVTNIISGFCTDCLGDNIEVVFQVVTWLGWMNSGMNPCIYACCSKDFNRAFRRILCCKKRRQSPLRGRRFIDKYGKATSPRPHSPMVTSHGSTSISLSKVSMAVNGLRKKQKSCRRKEQSNGNTVKMDQNGSAGPILATLVIEEREASNVESAAKLLVIKRDSMYSIPPPNYKNKDGPQRNFEILL